METVDSERLTYDWWKARPQDWRDDLTAGYRVIAKTADLPQSSTVRGGFGVDWSTASGFPFVPAVVTHAEGNHHEVFDPDHFVELIPRDGAPVDAG